ncbi:GNAT family N-acetyltransferase [Gynuella sp.]|uniref:GNAT family N-acetyltransferase n=1 Tax=Gynuella sp. TaxID=2969146 RepID=UPI003D11CAF0
MEFSKLKLPKGLSIRPSKPTDKAFLEQLYKSTREDLQQINAEQDFVESILDLQWRAQSQGYGDQYPNAMYFIIEKQGESVGNATLDFGPNEICLVDLALLPKARGLGYGGAAIQSFMYCAQQTMTPFSLCVLEQNFGARRLYQRLGFMVESVQLPYLRMVWYPKKIQTAG